MRVTITKPGELNGKEGHAAHYLVGTAHDIASLQSMKQWKSLVASLSNLSATGLTESGEAEFQGLQRLYLQSNQISDTGCAMLVSLSLSTGKLRTPRSSRWIREGSGRTSLGC